KIGAVARSATTSDFNRLSHAGILGVDLVSLFNELTERSSAAFFAVDQKHSRARRRQRVKPAQQVGLSGVPAEAVEGMHGGADGDLLAEDHDRFIAIRELPAQRAGTLITHKEDCRLWPCEAVSQVMQDSAAGAHARTGHDHEWSVQKVKRLGIP